MGDGCREDDSKLKAHELRRVFGCVYGQIMLHPSAVDRFWDMILGRTVNAFLFISFSSVTISSQTTSVMCCGGIIVDS